MSNSSDMKQATQEFINLLEQMADDAKSLAARIDERPALSTARMTELAGHYEKLSYHLLDAAFEMVAIRAAFETPSLEDADRELVRTHEPRAEALPPPRAPSGTDQSWDATVERTRARARAVCPGDWNPHERFALVLDPITRTRCSLCGKLVEQHVVSP
jgi:hypothetical protein